MKVRGRYFELIENVMNRRNQSFVFKSAQKMALRAPYIAICPQDLWTFMKQNVLSAIYWPLSKTTDWFRLYQHHLVIFNVQSKSAYQTNRAGRLRANLSRNRYVTYCTLILVVRCACW